MSIRIQNLTLNYGHQKALDGISFEVNEGEIVGFLGPNGAGKTTTLKVITCFLPPTSGKVLVNDFDVAYEENRIKRLIGYLPEHNPLYHDLYVREYLSFVGRLYDLKGKQLKTRINEIISLTGLSKEQNKKIGELSKGYKQRVGLAQALIHDPDVLVLDEPTTGLDPNQIAEVRQLIKNISATKTVILSTHIMQEVKAICDRVIIIHEGKIVADSTVEDLQHGSSNTMKIKVQLSNSFDIKLFRKIKAVINVEELDNNKYVITCSEDVREEIAKASTQVGVNLLELTLLEESLEDIFMSLTGTEQE